MQTMRPAPAEALATRLAPTGPCVLAIHGTDPATGQPRTWHLTPMVSGDGAPAGYRVDLADAALPQQRS